MGFRARVQDLGLKLRAECQGIGYRLQSYGFGKGLSFRRDMQGTQMDERILGSLLMTLLDSRDIF